MAENVTLKIWTPERTAFNRKGYRVVLPYGTTNLTVVEDRAPTSLVIHAGVLQILDESDAVKEWYFVDSGVADIANNECKSLLNIFWSIRKLMLKRLWSLKNMSRKMQYFTT